MDKMLTTDEIAERYGVTARAVRFWLADGRFPHAIRIGSGRRATWLVPPSDVDEDQGNADQEEAT